MPLGNGNLFLPVKAEIRKKIGKKEGDIVNVILYKDDSPLEIPYELLICLKDEPNAFAKFKKLNEAHQKEYISWIYSAKKDETRIARIAKTVSKVLKGQKLTINNVDNLALHAFKRNMKHRTLRHEDTNQCRIIGLL